MTRPVTLFTGQFADIPLAELAPKAAEWGYDGLELACWGTTWTSTAPPPTAATPRAGSSSSPSMG